MKRLLSSKARLMWAALAFLVVLLPLVVSLVEHNQSVFGSRSRPTSSIHSSSSMLTSKPTATLAPDFSAFVGEWYWHGRVLSFSSDGQAKYTARAYRWCGPDVSPPCDSWQGNTIIDGIHEDMRFTSVAGNTAYGTITASSDGTTGRAASFTIGANDTATFTKSGDSSGVLLCGQNAPPGTCGA
jgi:hypothetical protein